MRATYDLTSPTDDIIVTINIAPETGFNWTYVALAVGAISVVSIAVFVFIKLRRQDKKDTGNMQTTTKQNPNATVM